MNQHLSSAIAKLKAITAGRIVVEHLTAEEAGAVVTRIGQFDAACKLALPEIRCLYNQLACRINQRKEHVPYHVDKLPANHSVAVAVNAIVDALAAKEAAHVG